MGDADSKAPSSTTNESTEEETECSKKLKLNGGSEPSSTNNNEKSEATRTDISQDEDDPMKGKEEDTPQVTSTSESSSPPGVEEDEGPKYSIQVMYNKQPIQLSISPNITVLKLKKMIQEHVKVSPELQKVLLKGVAKDDAVLKDLGVGPNTKKILVIGSTIQDVMKVTEIPKDTGTAGGSSSQEASGSNWCSLTAHKKVIDKGLPDDVMPGILDEHDPLPPFPLSGMKSSKGGKVRLTFKLETDELWIGTKERTDKIPIGSIRNVLSQPITGYEHYHIVAIQIGPTEASRVFIYWVPAQYVEAIKDALTGA